MGIEDDLFDIDESILHDAGLDHENISSKKKKSRRSEDKRKSKSTTKENKE